MHSVHLNIKLDKKKIIKEKMYGKIGAKIKGWRKHIIIILQYFKILKTNLDISFHALEKHSLISVFD